MPKLEKTSKLPKVLILYTGGTFGMDVQRSKKDALAVPKLSRADLRRRFLERVPELSQLARCEVDIALNRDSAHLGPEHWCQLAERIQRQWKSYDGVVVLHGTDTLSYTASALSFLLRPCLRPVVITGAQRPLAALRTDARSNLISAVEIAASGPRKLVNQVSVFFDDRLYQGNRTHKKSAVDFGAFESPNVPALAEVGTEMHYSHPAAYPWLGRLGRKKTGVLRFKPEFSQNVALLTVTPGFPAKVLAQSLLPKLDGLVLSVYASGTAPTHDPEFIEFLRQAKKLRLPLVIVTGGSHPGTYAAGRALLAEGGIWAGEMTAECAYVKAALILGQERGRERFAKLWRMELAGEG